MFGYPSARSKMDYLERKVFGFNNHITPELLEAHVRCNNQHNLGNCDLVNKWANPLWALERKACDQWQANKELPRALQTFDWIDAARQKAIGLELDCLYTRGHDVVERDRKCLEKEIEQKRKAEELHQLEFDL